MRTLKAKKRWDASINTDFVRSNGDPYPFLKQIAEAGFQQIHWCHHWLDDFVYHTSEIKQIACRLGD